VDNLHQIVWNRLKEGYGAEDIAVMDAQDVIQVRRCIREFRADRSRIKAMYFRARAVRRGQCQKTNA
jgi:hypothetical protein